jgi:AcrR family transcriptional regulator
MRTEGGGEGEEVGPEGSLPRGNLLPPGLSRLPAGRHGLPADLVKENQRRRILSAALELFGTHGFAATSVQGLIREAHVSRATFYTLFTDKEDCLAAVFDEGAAWLRAETTAAIAGELGWPRALTVWVRRAIELLADDRRFARIFAVEVSFGGDAVAVRTREVIAELGAGLRRGRSEREWGDALPAVLEDLLVLGAISVIARRLVHEPGADTGNLAEELCETILIPYLGVPAAKSIVRDG